MAQAVAISPDTRDPGRSSPAIGRVTNRGSVMMKEATKPAAEAPGGLHCGQSGRSHDAAVKGSLCQPSTPAQFPNIITEPVIENSGGSHCCGGRPYAARRLAGP